MTTHDDDEDVLARGHGTGASAVGTASTHTAGPWVWEPYHIKTPGVEQAALLGEDGHGDGVLWHEASWPVTEANAHLIAAAPELLAACKAALEEGGAINGATRRGVIRAAIAKAEATA